MYDQNGEHVWQRELDANGKVIKETQQGICPFLYQGQYYDVEIELAYNRYRYYDPNTGNYISQDPIGLASEEYNFYNYVEDTNTFVDVFGLAKSYSKDPLKEGDVMTYKEYKKRRKKGSSLRGHHIPQQKRLKEKGIDPNDGTVVVVEHKAHTKTRSYGKKGRQVGNSEAGKSLEYSQNLDLQDQVIKDLGEDVIQNIKNLNKSNFPNHY